MGCCFCCLSEGEKVGKILENFPPSGVSQAQDGALQLVVGRIVLAGTAPFYSPGASACCVYFHITVEEEHESYSTDQNGNRQRHTSWHTICNQECFSDFYLQDGPNKIFVQASIRSACKIQSDVSGSGSNWHTFGMGNIPPGVQALIMRHGTPGYSWGMRAGITGNYRYTERSFDVGECVGAMGVITPANDPWTGQPVKFSKPFDGKSMPVAAMANWHDHAKEAWEEFSRTPVVLLTDSKKFTTMVQVQPLSHWQPPPCNWAVQFSAQPMGYPQYPHPV